LNCCQKIFKIFVFLTNLFYILLEIEQEKEENEMNQPKDLIEGEMNRNESFINTASKLLEKVKQQNSSNQMISKINQPTFVLGQFGKNSNNSSSISIKH
jgi:hypothetical protein